MSGWRFLTLERTKMNTWTRKRRMKFQKYWLKKHGHPFRWFSAEYKMLPVWPSDKEEIDVIFHIREQNPPDSV